MSFKKPFYQVPTQYTEKEPISNLINAGGAKFYGLYMALYDDVVTRNGFVSRNYLECKANYLGIKGKVLKTFLDVAIQEKLIVMFENDCGLDFYVIPEVLEFLKRSEKIRKETIERFNKYKQKVKAQKAMQTGEPSTDKKEVANG